MSDVLSVSEVLSRYKSALEKIETTDPKASADDALKLLLARDTLQVNLLERFKSMDTNLIEIHDFDKRLKKQKKVIMELLNLADWRSIIEPPAQNWWWFFPSGWESFDWLWNTINIFALSASLSLAINTSSRLLTGGVVTGPDLTVILHGALTLIVGGGAFTQVGKDAFEKILIGLNIRKEFWQEISCGLSLLLLAFFFGINSSLPSWAITINNNGVDNLNKKRIESAKADFERAIAMRPNYGEARYNLGSLYEEINDLEKARAQYELAIQSDVDKFDKPINQIKAKNNLGRLYILKKEYGTAVKLLKAGYEIFESKKNHSNIESVNPSTIEPKSLIVPNPATKNLSSSDNYPQLSYSLLKNLGWARFMQKRYDQAEDKLKKAAQVEPNRSSSYCLLAQVLEAKYPKDLSKAQSTWFDCKNKENNGDFFKPEEDDWYGLADQRLNKNTK
jgi:tetratricopeptide (TPR) repeat protein